MNLFNEFQFVPYQMVGDLKFKGNENNIESILGEAKEKYKNYGGGKTVRYNSFGNDLQIYFNDIGEFIGIHFLKSIKFILNGKMCNIDFDSFKKSDLISLSDDFIITAEEEGIDYTSKKLGIDFYFDNDENLQAVLFMNEDYIKELLN